MTTVTLRTRKGEEFIVDMEDVPRVSQHTWHLSDTGYLMSTIQGKRVRLHRFVLNLAQADRQLVDHKDRNKLNNSKANLRFATKSQNGANVNKQGGTSEYKGVSWSTSRGKWLAQIKHNQKTYNLGRFDTEEAAAMAYNARAAELFGEFAVMNAFLPFY